MLPRTPRRFFSRLLSISIAEVSPRTVRLQATSGHLALSKLSPLVLAILGMSASPLLQAAGLEYTKQSILPLFEAGNYAEATYASVNIEIEGEDSQGQKINDVMDEFDIYGAAVKISPNDATAFAMIYDQPFGVDTLYPSNNEFSNEQGTTEARVETQSLTFLGSGKLADGVSLYGGVEYQQAKGAVTLAQQFDGIPVYYELDIPDTSETIIPVAGVAYEIPDIMLRAAVTWRGSGEHELKANETLTVDIGMPTSYNDLSPPLKDAFGLPDVNFDDTTLRFTTPQSVNLDFQTGLSEKYQLLGMLNARWVEWSAFNISPDAITQVVEEPLASYNKDAYSVEVALGKQFTPKFAGEVRVGYDSGTGEPLSLLGPYDAIETLAIGGSYEVTQNLSISAGGQYMWFEGGKAYSEVSGDKLGEFDDGKGYALGMKVGYQF